jgi:hypothetical protein
MGGLMRRATKRNARVLQKLTGKRAIARRSAFIRSKIVERIWIRTARNHRMPRFSSIIYGCALTVAAVAIGNAQAPHRKVPVKRGENTQSTVPAPVQQPMQQMNQQGSPAPNAAQQMNQQGSPAPNAAQQMSQQQSSRPAEPPPNTQPSPPVVTYRDGMLTVQAVNSTLNSVVAAIKSKTGIEFENWESVPDRVAISQGPAPSGEVLAAIFSGSRFNFIAIGRPDSPDVVQRIIFSPKQAPGNTAAAAAQRPPQNSGQDGDDEDTPDETVNAGGGDPQDTAAQPPVMAPQGQQQIQNQQPKTPDQLLQELQEMQKQQQQQQQGNQNPSQVPRKPPPN